MPAQPAARYPWEALDVVSRTAVARASTLRRRFERAVSSAALGRAIGETLASEASVIVHRVEPADSPAALPAARVDLELERGSARVVIGLEPALASAMLARVLQQPVRLEPPDLPLSPALQGALAAVAIEVGRATHGIHPLQVRPPGRSAPTRQGLALGATLMLDGRPYRAGIWLTGDELPTAEPSDPVDLATLGSVPVSVPVVGGICLATRSQLEQLRIGDAFLCDSGWWVDGTGRGRCALAAPTSDRGVAATLGDGGQLVLGSDAVDLSLDVAMDDAMTDSNDTLTDAVLDAPIVVRVELGTVSMTAREWARLAAGDVILSGRRIADPAVLRVAGREVARGELVSVDGELGVRIQHIETGDQDA